MVGLTNDLLDDIRAQLAPDDAVLKEARARRDAVLGAAVKFHGALRTFTSGSLAHGTANCPVHQRDKGLDADGGVVLDRRIWTSLGPDSATKGRPTPVVEQVRDAVAWRVRQTYPKATVEITKRAVLVEFHERLPGGEDPSADLVVGLTRADAPGLWIPNTELDRWDPSDPEKHTELLTGQPAQLRRVRARAIRLAKAEMKRNGDPLLCSFNLEAFGLMFVQPGMGQADALLAMWRQGAADLSRRLTPDPAGVSAPIKCQDRTAAIMWLNDAAALLANALRAEGNGSSDAVRRALYLLWPDFVATRPGEASRARTVAATRAVQTMRVASTGVLTTGAGVALKSPRSYGG